MLVLVREIGCDQSVLRLLIGGPRCLVQGVRDRAGLGRGRGRVDQAGAWSQIEERLQI